jgi:hypothetical protein
MVPGVFDGLRLSQSANGQHTEYKQNGQNFEDAVVHRQTPKETLAV